MLQVIDYSVVMGTDQSPLSQWLLGKFLNWQQEKGRRASITEFAEHLEISQTYASKILSGERNSVSYQIAIKLAEKTGDMSILEILGYNNEPKNNNAPLPPGMRDRLEAAFAEIYAQYKAAGITNPASPEAEAIAIAVMQKHGFTYRK